MRLHGPICAQGTCLDVLCSPDLPAARAVVEGPLPPRQNPQRSFAAANVRKCSSAEHPPPPSLRPHSAARPLAVATLATPDASKIGGGVTLRAFLELEGWPGASETSTSVVGHQGSRTQPACAPPLPQLAPARACPSAPLRSPAREGT